VRIHDSVHRCSVSERSVCNSSGRGTVGTISNGLGIDGAVSNRLGEGSRRSRQVVNLESLQKLEDSFVVMEIVINCTIR
jgi:hypothetical protein